MQRPLILHMPPASEHGTVMNAFKGTIQQNPSILGSSWNLKPSITEGLIFFLLQKNERRMKSSHHHQFFTLLIHLPHQQLPRVAIHSICFKHRDPLFHYWADLPHNCNLVNRLCNGADTKMTAEQVAYR